ncbi:MAG TPA: hypothetical protein VK894_05805 [Jiangellales bacterium]|nr:hypothetical protein [Jiangellales bacterium]
MRLAILTPHTAPRTASGAHKECRAVTTAVTVIGLLVAMAAAEHGVGEVVQRPDLGDGPLITSWPDAAVFEQLDGEPAMTLLPGPVLAGLVTIALAALFAWVALRNGAMPHAGAALLVLAGALLLAGGGLAPPLIGSLLGLTWFVVRRRGGRRPGRFGQRLAGEWRVALVATTVCYLALFPGTVLLHWWFGVNSAALVAVLGLGAFAGLFVLLPAAVAADRFSRESQP